MGKLSEAEKMKNSRILDDETSYADGEVRRNLFELPARSHECRRIFHASYFIHQPKAQSELRINFGT